MATLPLLPRVPQTNGGVLVASSDASLREQLVTNLNSQPCPVLVAHGGADALGKLESSECDILLLDRELSDLDSDELVRLVQSQYPGVEILQIDARTRSVVGAPRRWTAGVSDVFRALERLTGVSRDIPVVGSTATTAHKSSNPPSAENLPGMVGRSSAMLELYRNVRLVAKRTTTVLVTGPTGSGKELVARAVHELSERAKGPFVVINCAAIPEALLEAELFGYARGAFTGAVQSRTGRIQAAQEGTLFLDEIGELPLGLQAKLLRFLERGEVQRLGSSDTFEVDVRVVAATNANLLERVEQREFREDLYYRLSVFPIEVPSLSDRSEDIVALAEHFLSRLAAEGTPCLGDEVKAKLTNHSWPGNVRELMHVMERALIVTSGSPIIRAEDIRFAPLSGRTERQSLRKGPVCV